MTTLTAKAKAFFDRIFPERQIYHRSGGTVRYISVSPWQQAIMSTGAAAVIGWCLFATGSYLMAGPATGFEAADQRELAKYERWVQELRAKDSLSRSLLEERTDAFQQATLDFEQRHQTLQVLLEALQEGESVELTALRGDGASLLVEPSVDEADARTSREQPVTTASLEVVGVRAQIDQLRSEQEQFLDEAEDIAVERSEKARGVLRLTAVGVGRITAEAEMGGPLVDMTALSLSPNADPEAVAFAQRVAQVAARLEEAKYFEDIVDNLPLATPIGVPSRITSDYGVRIDPFTKRPNWHGGVDMGAFYKAPITAAGPGTVVYAGRRTGYGRVVDIDHGFGFKSRYAHLQSIKVRKGDKVVIGDTIGLMGSSGRSTGPHLHYEVSFNGKPYNPEQFLKAGRHVYQN
ncbi:MAG: peptidoglycan DD-metalloendopeptidase family protein [Pseudomonadota bacterium]